MKRLIPALLALIGASAPAATASAEVKSVDPRSIRFSMPTVAADELQLVMPTKQSFEGAPQFHEDEWCQIEFFPEQRVEEIKRLLTEYKAFESKHRVQHGWTQIYARRIPRAVIVPGARATDELAGSIEARRLPAPILTTASRPLGQVSGGFTLGLPGGVFLYGIASEQGASSLAAMVGRGGDDAQLSKAFITLNKSHRLILVDWRSQMLLLSVNALGDLNVWRP